MSRRPLVVFGIVAAACALIAVAATYAVFHPPALIVTSGDVDLDIPKDTSAGVALAWQARKFIGTSIPRVEETGFFGSAYLFVPRADWEKIAYPDRPTVGAILARAWCARVGNRRTFLTKVTVRDIQTGQDLRQCYCE